MAVDDKVEVAVSLDRGAEIGRVAAVLNPQAITDSHFGVTAFDATKVHSRPITRRRLELVSTSGQALSHRVQAIAQIGKWRRLIPAVHLASKQYRVGTEGSLLANREYRRSGIDRIESETVGITLLDSHRHIGTGLSKGLSHVEYDRLVTLGRTKINSGPIGRGYLELIGTGCERDICAVDGSAFVFKGIVFTPAIHLTSNKHRGTAVRNDIGSA